MKTILLSAAFAASMLAPAAVHAQALPATTVAVVDLDRVTRECAACKTASAALKSQVTGLQNRQKTLGAPLQSEQTAIQAAINALNGKEPDATLQARIRAFEAKRQQAAEEVGRQEQQIQRNQQYIQQQIATKLGPIYQQVMQRRGANVMMEIGSTLASSSGIDVTNDILAALNSALPSIQTTAPAQAQQKQPQGR